MITYRPPTPMDVAVLVAHDKELFPYSPWNSAQYKEELAGIPATRFYSIAENDKGEVIGYAGVTDLDVGKLDLYLDDVWVARHGGRHPDYREEDGQRVMKQSEITVRVTLARGNASSTVWTCDLSHDHVSINADYRS